MPSGGRSRLPSVSSTQMNLTLLTEAEQMGWEGGMPTLQN